MRPVNSSQSWVFCSIGTATVTRTAGVCEAADDWPLTTGPQDDPDAEATRCQDGCQAHSPATRQCFVQHKLTLWIESGRTPQVYLANGDRRHSEWGKSRTLTAR